MSEERQSLQQPLLGEVQEKFVILSRQKGIGKKAVNGLAGTYDSTYPKPLLSIGRQTIEGKLNVLLEI